MYIHFVPFVPLDVVICCYVYGLAVVYTYLLCLFNVFSLSSIHGVGTINYIFKLEWNLL